MDTGAPPVIPAEFQQYNSYVEDPKWQIKFTVAWVSFLGLAVFLSLRHLLNGRKWWCGVFGVMEDWRERYILVGKIELASNSRGERRSRTRDIKQRSTARILSSLGSIFYWTPPGIGLNSGQLGLIIAYLATVVTCIVLRAPLIANPNRAGFMALAQFPVVFLLSTKNSVLSLALPPFFSYTRLNPLHRWAGRAMFLAAVIHGSLWIRNHLEWNIPILGQQKETSGVAALAMLCVVVISSLRWVRAWAWQIFFWIHMLSFPAFFITVCYHTIYAAPWILPPVALYAFDLLMRLFRYRIKDAQLFRVDSQMTLIRIPDCDIGWTAGQHIRLRVFFAGRGVFESHPLSIMCAPRGMTCVQAKDLETYSYARTPNTKEEGEIKLIRGEAPGILLGARVMGDWTRSLNEYARIEEERLRSVSCPSSSKSIPLLQAPVNVQVMIDGPYGGCSINFDKYERLLLVAGGSGATFAVGVLDELVKRRSTLREKTITNRIELVWCVRSFGSIKWFAPLLFAIASTALASSLDLRIIVYVTCLCSPEDLPSIPGLEVRVGGRPNMGRLVDRLISPSVAEENNASIGKAGDSDSVVSEGDRASVPCTMNEGLEMDAEKAGENRYEGKLGVCASGPESLTREVANAIAGHMGKGREIGLHTEMFSI